MKTLLFIHGGKVDGHMPVAHFLLRLSAALEYHRQHQGDEEMMFFVSGRQTNVTEYAAITEAEVGKRWICEQLPDATVIKEDISVELIGNFAFSKPLIRALKPDKVVIFTSRLLLPRVQAITQKVFADDCVYEIASMTDELLDNPDMVEREVRATELFSNVFNHIEDGDDAGVRDTLLYSTPYYFKGIVDDKLFFDTYWRGGLEHFVRSRSIRKETN